MEKRSEISRQYRQSQLSQDYLTYILPLGAVVYLSFSIIDALYVGFSTELYYRFLFYRLFATLPCLFLLVFFLSKPRSETAIYSAASFFVIISCSLINLMILDTGGFESEYLQGVLLVVTGGVFILNMPFTYTLVTLGLSLLPTVLMIFITAPDGLMKLALVKASFPIGMAALILAGVRRAERQTLSFVDEKVTSSLTEILKRAVPPELRFSVERGNAEILTESIRDDVLVGFIDIASSTAISRVIGNQNEWHLKCKLFSRGMSIASQYRLSIINLLGDGILITNDITSMTFHDSDIFCFYERLKVEFEDIIEPYKHELDKRGVLTGLRCGASVGSIITGIMGNEKQSFFTVSGLEVNLASRISDFSSIGGIVYSGHLFNAIGGKLPKSVEISESLVVPKGFEQSVKIYSIEQNVSNIVNIA